MKLAVGTGISWIIPRGQGAPIPPNTLIAGRGVFVLTGDAMNSNFAAAMDLGTFVETGNAAAFSQGTVPVLSAATGNFLLTGNNAALLGANVIGASQGTFAESGNVAGLGIAMPAAAGSFVETGNAATLTNSGGSTTTLNPSDKGAAVVLSGGNLIISNTTFAFGNARAIASHSSGKFYFEITANVSVYSFDSFGIANAAEVLSANYCGSSFDSCGNIWQGATADINGASLGMSGAGTTGGGNIFGCAVDLTAKLIWFRTCNGSSTAWNAGGTADPATGIGGYSLSTLNAGPYFPMLTVAQTTDNYTANFGGSAYTAAAPSGFGNW